MCLRPKHIQFRDDDEEAPVLRCGLVCHAPSIKVLLLLLLVKLLKAPGQNNVMCASVPFILKDLDIDDFTFARAFAIGTALAAMVQPKLGGIIDDRGVAFSLMVGLVGLAIGLGSLTLISAPAPTWMLVGSWLFIRATAIGTLEAACSAAIALHFTRFRGRATALMQVINGLPTGALTSLIQASDLAIGWRVTLRFAAAAPVALALACRCLLPRGTMNGSSATKDESPCQSPCQGGTASLELSAVNPAQTPVAVVPKALADAPSGSNSAQPSLSPQDGTLTRRCGSVFGCGRGSSTYTLLTLYFSVFWSTTIYGGIDLFSVEMASPAAGGLEVGYDIALIVFLPVGLFTSIVVVLCGFLIDRGVAPSTISAAGNALSAVCALCATRLDTPIGGLTYALSRGLSSGAFAASAGLLIPQFFGKKRLGKLLGGQALCYVIGTCNGSLLLGMASERFGSFAPVLYAFAIPALLIAAMQLTLRRSEDDQHVDES